MQELQVAEKIDTLYKSFFFTFIIRRNVILLQRNNMQIYQPYISFGGVMSGTKWGRKRGERRQRPKATDGQ